VKPAEVGPFTDWAGKSVTVFGMGRSGETAANLLSALGARVTILEENNLTRLEQVKARLSERGIRVLLGPAVKTSWQGTDMLVVSPGIPIEHPVLQAVRAHRIPVIGEIELASWFLNAPIVAVTGTNGKSTTVRLIGSILEHCGNRVFVGGNLGTPLSEAVMLPGRMSSSSCYDWIVAEVSSFQLETIHGFHPKISVLLNVTPDHLDRHPTQEAYIAAKQRIFENQTIDDAMVINMDDPLVCTMASQGRAQPYGFSLRGPVERGVFLHGRDIRARFEGREMSVMDRTQFPLPGDHNVANALAAIGVGLLCRCPVEAMASALQHTPTFEHALEPVREWNGVRFINDSKGTNVDATLKAIQSFQEPLIVILGGKDKGGDFSQLAQSIHRHVKHVVVMGEATPRIVSALGRVKPITLAGTLTEAVQQAVGAASRGDIVLFSPACASFDMFQNYHHRGLEFKRIVGELS
jgi:UDP-N-acetylmuramoylalanine--D-glutamate ligase